MDEDDEDPGKETRWDWDQISDREKDEHFITVLSLIALLFVMYRLCKP